MRPALVLSLIISSFASAETYQTEDLIKLSMDEILNMNIKITSASKRSERSFDSASATYVISQDDIHRSGVTSIPEALRMAPGVQVSRISASEWGVSVRGLNGRFSRYLLVLVDGRSVYDPLFSGVNWDELNIALEDIDHIEVIRGASGTLWGANAMNGVINIVTQAPDQLKGPQAAITAGNEDKLIASAQGASQIGEKTWLKISGNHHQRDGFEASHLDANEGKDSSERISFKLLHQKTDDRFDVSADVYQMDNQQLWADYRLTHLNNPAPYIRNDEDKQGYALQFQWQHELSEFHSLRMRLSHDSIKRDSNTFYWDTDNTDFDIEWLSNFRHHQITAGFNSRYSQSDASGVNNYPITLRPSDNNIGVYSFFIHDTLLFFDDWQITAGARFEDNSETGDDIQGTLRAIWSAHENQRLWFAASRVHNTPSRINTDDSSIIISTAPGSPQTGGLPLAIQIGGTGEDVSNAELKSIEIGYRLIPNPQLSIDITAFYNEYENLLSRKTDSTEITVEPITMTPYILSSATFTDKGKRKADGFELSATWHFAKQWQIQYSGHYIHYKNQESAFNSAVPSDGLPQDLAMRLNNIQVDRDNPTHQHSLRIMGKLNHQWSASTWLRYVDQIDLINIDSYSSIDIKVDYRPSPQWQLSLVGQNLGGEHSELTREAFAVDSFEVPTSYYLKAQYRF